MKYLVSTINCYYYFHCINEETEAGSIEDTYLCDIAIESWRKKNQSQCNPRIHMLKTLCFISLCIPQIALLNPSCYIYRNYPGFRQHNLAF